MAPKALPSPEVLRQLLRYEPETGNLFWLPREIAQCASIRSRNIWNKRFAGRQAFTHVAATGYLQGGIFDRLHQAHRVIWAMQTGSWPGLKIDHINGNRTDNRWANLRLVTDGENNLNQKRFSNNTSGFTGVGWSQHRGGWTAIITLQGKRQWLGCYDTPEAAHQARKRAEAELGFHPNHGRT